MTLPATPSSSNAARRSARSEPVNCSRMRGSAAEAVEDRTDDGQVQRRARFDEDAPPAGQSSDRLIDAPDPESDPARQRPSEAAGRGHYIAP